MTFIRSIGSFVAAASLSGAGEAQAPDEYVELFDGTLRGWTVESSQEGNFSVVGGHLRVGGPHGWLRSDRQYTDFELIIEFRFLTDDADSGVFFRVAGDEPFARGWPNRSYQLQMLNPFSDSRFQPLGGLFRHGMPDDPDTSFDEPAARRVTLPTGEWQRLELSVRSDRAIAAINGTVVLRAGGIGNSRGWIGLQGETGALEFRSIRIRAE